MLRIFRVNCDLIGLYHTKLVVPVRIYIYIIVVRIYRALNHRSVCICTIKLLMMTCVRVRVCANPNVIPLFFTNRFFVNEATITTSCICNARKTLFSPKDICYFFPRSPQL